jgi:hypothetical protein
MIPITDGRGKRASILATEKAAKLPEAENGGHEEQNQDRDRSNGHQRNDHAFHGASVPRRFRV